MDHDEICLCGHGYAEHGPRTGRCRGLDSYGCPCRCPAPVPDGSCPDGRRGAAPG